MSDPQPLPVAIRAHVHPGDVVALEGFTHLIPYAAGHEIIRQGITGLTLARVTPDALYDQMIGMGVADRLIRSWGGNPDVGSLHRFRDAIENGWPCPLTVEEHSHAGMAVRYAGTGLPAHTDTITPMTCLFTRKQLAAVPALKLDVAIVHAQQVDRAGNVGIWGTSGVQKTAVLAAHRSIVTVEEQVARLDPRCSVVLPSWTVTAVCIEPRGAHPSCTMGYYERDNGFYAAWDAISRDRRRFQDWVSRHVFETGSFAEHLALLGDADTA